MATRISKRRAEQRGATVVAIILGAGIIGGALVISRRQHDASDLIVSPAPVVAQFDTIEVPVPAEPIPAGTKLSAVKLVKIAFPKHQVPEGAVVDLLPFSEAVTLTAIPARLPLFRENLSLTAGLTNPVVERIPKGMRAMTIKVDATSSVEGWAGSGSIVDVLLIERDKTAVIAESVKILSAERSMSPVEGSAAPKLPTTVTLLVTQEQCLAINTAIPRGRIAFALRSTQDTEQWINTVYTADHLKQGSTGSEAAEVVTGFVRIEDEGSPKSFALAGGKWTRTEAIPRGFLLNKERNSEKSSPRFN